MYMPQAAALIRQWFLETVDIRALVARLPWSTPDKEQMVDFIEKETLPMLAKELVTKHWTSTSLWEMPAFSNRLSPALQGFPGPDDGALLMSCCMGSEALSLLVERLGHELPLDASERHQQDLNALLATRVFISKAVTAARAALGPVTAGDVVQERARAATLSTAELAGVRGALVSAVLHVVAHCLKYQDVSQLLMNEDRLLEATSPLLMKAGGARGILGADKAEQRGQLQEELMQLLSRPQFVESGHTLRDLLKHNEGMVVYVEIPHSRAPLGPSSQKWLKDFTGVGENERESERARE